MHTSSRSTEAPSSHPSSSGAPVPGDDCAREPARRRRLAAPVATGIAALAGAALLAARSPHVGGSYGMCPVLLVTGMQCAGCGVLRATHDLARGDLAGAWALNPVWVAAVPVLVALWIFWLRRRWRGEAASAVLRSPALPFATAALLVAYSVLRNLVPALAA